MATPKQITISDIQQRTLRIEPPVNGDLHVTRDYIYVDGNGDPIPELSQTQVKDVTVAWASVPANIKTALQTIDAWLYASILADEGMS